MTKDSWIFYRCILEEAHRVGTRACESFSDFGDHAFQRSILPWTESCSRLIFYTLTMDGDHFMRSYGWIVIVVVFLLFYCIIAPCIAKLSQDRRRGNLRRIVETEANIERNREFFVEDNSIPVVSVTLRHPQPRVSSSHQRSFRSRINDEWKSGEDTNSTADGNSATAAKDGASESSVNIIVHRMMTSSSSNFEADEEVVLARALPVVGSSISGSSLNNPISPDLLTGEDSTAIVQVMPVLELEEQQRR